MKKILLSLLVLAASANIFAAIDYNAGADIQIKGNTSNKTHLFTVAEITNANPGQYCAEMYEGTFGSAKVAFYAIADSKKYEIFASNDVDFQALGVKTYTDTEYTLSFSNLKGEGTLYLVDGNKYIAIVNGGSYTFTAEANTTITDRFSIVKNIPAKFINNQLVITDAATGAEVNVTPFSFVEGRRVDGQKVTYNAPVNQALNGNYFEVEYTNKNGVARKFIVNANPNVLPANN